MSQLHVALPATWSCYTAAWPHSYHWHCLTDPQVPLETQNGLFLTRSGRLSRPVKRLNLWKRTCAQIHAVTMLFWGGRRQMGLKKFIESKSKKELMSSCSNMFNMIYYFWGIRISQYQSNIYSLRYGMFRMFHYAAGIYFLFCCFMRKWNRNRKAEMSHNEHHM